MNVDANATETVEVDFTLAVGTGKLEASVQVPTRTLTLTQLLPVLQTLSSNIIGATVGVVTGEGHQISCKAGCGACCRQLVPLSLFEAEALGGWIRSLPEEQQRQLEARFDQALTGLRDSGVLQRMDAQSMGQPAGELETFALDYMAAKVACPFLVEESCSIHPIRPLICREYLVTSPPEFCANPTRETVQAVPMPILLSKSLTRIGALLPNESKGWMPLVFLFAWMKKGARPGDSFQAPGPELLHEFIKRLSADNKAPEAAGAN